MTALPAGPLLFDTGIYIRTRQTLGDLSAETVIDDALRELSQALPEFNPGPEAGWL